MGYQPIENYGVIGDMHTVALVSMHGSIDWFCFPYFSSPSIFAAILDENKGGTFRIHPTFDDLSYKQLYWPETNVLVTRFLSHDGVGEIIDYMPVTVSRKSAGKNQLVRHVRCVRGSMQFDIDCQPAFDYGRAKHTTHIHDEGAIFRSDALDMALLTDVPLKANGDRVHGEFNLEMGDSAFFMLKELKEETDCFGCFSKEEAEELFQHTVNYWRRWLGKCHYSGRWREIVHRSALLLKLLTFHPTGAIVAAPTTSLPEIIPGTRNWDYRYTWIRDAAFTVYSFMRLGFTEEAGQFMRWVEHRVEELEPDGQLQIMYGIHGEHNLTEEKLSHFEGYRQASPVRIGNGAYGQLQLDIYGELMDSIYLYNKYGTPISYDFWKHICQMIDWLIDNWQRADEGIWEVRGGPQQFVYSKLMCWVALDRAIRLADKRSFPAPRERWLLERDAIYKDIMKRGYNKKMKAFVQSFDSEILDASVLVMPLVLFISPTDNRMLGTIDAIMRSPQHGGLVSDSLVYRYNVEHTQDGVGEEEGTFNICTFWLVEALTRAGKTDRRLLEKARLIFEQMLGYANHLGLFGEETGPRGEALGNFPQAFTHLSLISAAYNLDRTLDEAKM